MLKGLLEKHVDRIMADDSWIVMHEMTSGANSKGCGAGASRKIETSSVS
jgi:hypothetical protein